MKKTVPFLLACAMLAALLALSVSGQTMFQPTEHYLRLTGRAHRFYLEQKYLSSGQTYDSAILFTRGKGYPDDLYAAACSWALAGKSTKAFFYLNAAIGNNWHDLTQTRIGQDLASLHTDTRWQPLLDKLKERDNAARTRLNKPLAATLDSTYTDDQGVREKLMEVAKVSGWDSPRIDSLEAIIGHKDSVNLVRVKSIIARYGWPGITEVGDRGAGAVFLVIQHADSLDWAVYLPLMKQAVKKGEARSQYMALMEDRLMCAQKKVQLYGSQVRSDKAGNSEFWPIVDEQNVNKRRASVGLGPIEEYARELGISYKAPDKKNR